MSKMTYHNAPAKLTECYECGEKSICEIIVADSPEAETGYVGEYAVCEACKNGLNETERREIIQGGR